MADSDNIEESCDLINVEVAYATPERQLIIALRVRAGTTAYEAVCNSGISKEFEQIDLDKDSMGIFSRPLDGKGRPTPHEYILKPGDRVEIYRVLQIDPKQARLARAAKKQSQK